MILISTKHTKIVGNRGDEMSIEKQEQLDDLMFLDKSIVVTGAAAGMGKKITIDFLKKGATVIAVDINGEALNNLKDELHREYKDELAKRCIVHIGDISKQQTNEDMIHKAIEATGTIDVLINNAGIAGHSEPITETSNEDWDKILAVNLNGPMYAIREAVKQMETQKNGGSIVTIASVAGIKGCRSSVAYTVAKHGLVGLCQHTAYAYMHKGIRSNIVCPGAIRTGMTSNPELESSFGRERIMSGMDSNFVFGDTGDISDAVLFLASEKAKFINGATLVVDGGISCN